MHDGWLTHDAQRDRVTDSAPLRVGSRARIAAGMGSGDSADD